MRGSFLTLVTIGLAIVTMMAYAVMTLESLQESVDAAILSMSGVPTKVENLVTMDWPVPCWLKTVDIGGTPVQVSWYCPPREDKESEEDYAARCARLFKAYCDGLGE